jgi:hypothetical protein
MFKIAQTSLDQKAQLLRIRDENEILVQTHHSGVGAMLATIFETIPETFPKATAT